MIYDIFELQFIELCHLAAAKSEFMQIFGVSKQVYHQFIWLNHKLYLYLRRQKGIRRKDDNLYDYVSFRALHLDAHLRVGIICFAG